MKVTDLDRELFEAIKSDDLSAVDAALAQGADINGMDEDGFTALCWAVSCGHGDIVHFLIDQGVDLNARDGEGLTALQFAVCHDQLELVQLLIEKGADVGATDRCGNTALDFTSSPEIVNFLKQSIPTSLKGSFQ